MTIYPALYTWLKRELTTNDVDNERKESWPENGTLWGSYPDETFGRRNTEFGADQSGSNATILIRHRPALSANDRLIFEGRTWIIDSIHRDGLNLSCDCYSYDTLVV